VLRWVLKTVRLDFATPQPRYSISRTPSAWSEDRTHRSIVGQTGKALWFACRHHSGEFVDRTLGADCAHDGQRG